MAATSTTETWDAAWTLTLRKNRKRLTDNIFDEYPYASEGTRGFHKRFTSGEKMRAGWVNPGDFEKEPVTDR